MSENNALEVSWPTDLSPTTIFRPAAHAGHASDSAVGGRGVPGVVRELGGYWGGLYRVPSQAIPGPSI